MRLRSLFEALLTPEDAVISDELNHASIIDGIRLCKARKSRYKHKDMKGIEKEERVCVFEYSLFVQIWKRN